MARLHTAKWFEHRAFFTNSVWGASTKGTILYWVWRDDRWLLVTKRLVWYIILLAWYVYVNTTTGVTQGVGSLLNSVGLTPTRRYHGWHRAGKFSVSRSLEMAFSESFLPLRHCDLWVYAVYDYRNQTGKTLFEFFIAARISCRKPTPSVDSQLLMALWQTRRLAHWVTRRLYSGPMGPKIPYTTSFELNQSKFSFTNFCDKFTFSCVRSTSLPWQVLLLVCMQCCKTFLSY
jgi:hypothetical protein